MDKSEESAHVLHTKDENLSSVLTKVQQQMETTLKLKFSKYNLSHECFFN